MRSLALTLLLLALAGCQPPSAGGAAAPGGEVIETKVLAATEAKPVELGAEPVTVEVPLRPEDNQRLLQAAAEPGRLLLAIEGLRLLGTGPAYEVYLDLPEGAAPDPEGPHFLGLVALFVPPGHPSEVTRSFDLSRAVQALRERGRWTEELRVTFVPADGDKVAAPAGPSLRFRRLVFHTR
ncbi:MAG TPA: hypothetical protein VF121_17675 [Thermoanaerobaculia bacterium]|nr:hypothetical protein [Thermoanaerobaculia bacterium]